MRFAGRMQTESVRLTRLVQQIIDLSRLQNDTASEEAAVVKVDELVAEAAEHSATEAERKHIDIAIAPSSPSCSSTATAPSCTRR